MQQRGEIRETPISPSPADGGSSAADTAIVNGETWFPHPPAFQGRTERMSADGRYGVGMRWVVLTPSPSPAKLESLR